MKFTNTSARIATPIVVGLLLAAATGSQAYTFVGREHYCGEAGRVDTFYDCQLDVCYYSTSSGAWSATEVRDTSFPVRCTYYGGDSCGGAQTAMILGQAECRNAPNGFIESWSCSRYSGGKLAPGEVLFGATVDVVPEEEGLE
ncbi:hypothetical protein F4778DRAFT_724362 [Xylariomycetidae sp. FL2044]|nr:hypothetical protein F4778DRAFT_724362 [Xylariomycetidae sp. FL2044]